MKIEPLTDKELMEGSNPFSYTRILGVKLNEIIAYLNATPPAEKCDKCHGNGYVGIIGTTSFVRCDNCLNGIKLKFPQPISGIMQTIDTWDWNYSVRVGQPHKRILSIPETKSLASAISAFLKEKIEVKMRKYPNGHDPNIGYCPQCDEVSFHNQALQDLLRGLGL